jgi:hypothetical protein
MANDFSVLLPNILGQALIHLRKSCRVLQHVKRDFSTEVGKPGATIDFKGRTTFAVATPSATPSAQEIQTDGESMTLNLYQEVPFSITQKEASDLQANNGLVLTDAVKDAVEAISNYITAQVYGQYKKFYTFVGTNGTVPSAVSDITAIKLAARKLMWPVDRNRTIAWDGASEAKLLQLGVLTEMGATGDDAIQTGNLGFRLGFNHLGEEQPVDDLAHTAGAAANYNVDQADVAVGDKTVHLEVGTGDWHEGDIFTVAGDTQQYVVTALVAGDGDIDVAFEPAAKVAWANDAAVSLLATQSHFSLAWHRDAIGLAIRPLAKSISPYVMDEVVTDPDSGLSMLMRVEGKHIEDMVTLRILGGVGVLNRALGIRVASGA